MKLPFYPNNSFLHEIFFNTTKHSVILLVFIFIQNITNTALLIFIYLSAPLWLCCRYKTIVIIYKLVKICANILWKFLGSFWDTNNNILTRSPNEWQNTWKTRYYNLKSARYYSLFKSLSWTRNTIKNSSTIC